MKLIFNFDITDLIFIFIRILIPSIIHMAANERSLWDIIPEYKWMDFRDARIISREYGFEYKEEWEAFVNGKFPDRKPLPGDVPVNPEIIYKHIGWKGWPDWLIPAEKRKEYSDFHKTREFVRCLRIKDVVGWRDYIIRGELIHLKYGLIIPEKPDLEYIDKGWKDWDDWLGTKISYKDYKTTMNFVKTLKLKNKSEWEDYSKNQLTGKKPKPVSIYAFPEIAYRDSGWTGWDQWLGII